MVRTTLLILALLAPLQPAVAVEPYSYLNPELSKWGSEWAVAVDRLTLDRVRSVSVAMSYGPPNWLIRGRGGLLVGGDLVPGALLGVEFPLIEMDSEGSNARSWGLYLRGDQQLDAKLRPLTSVALGASFAWSGPSGPGLLVTYTSEGSVLLSLTITGAVGLR